MGGDRAKWAKQWSLVFANRSVSLVGHPFAQRGTQGSADQVMYGSTDNTARWREVSQASHRTSSVVAVERLAPFELAREVYLLREGALPLYDVRQWFTLRDLVLGVVESMLIDVVAVAWGPQ